VCNKKRKLKGGGERGAHSGGIRGQPQHELCVFSNFRSNSENMNDALAVTRGSITAAGSHMFFLLWQQPLEKCVHFLRRRLATMRVSQ
jgi:hypothetical protein